VGDIIQNILESGFEITALEQFKLEKENASEFLEVYKGVLQEYAVSMSCSPLQGV
jgi:nucleoside-diphosphate kinase